MIKIICDKCKKDCDLVAYDITTRVLQNPTPHSVRDLGEPKITSENTHMRFTLCQTCYAKLGFPNIYAIDKKGLEFEENEK